MITRNQCEKGGAREVNKHRKPPLHSSCHFLTAHSILNSSADVPSEEYGAPSIRLIPNAHPLDIQGFGDIFCILVIKNQSKHMTLTHFSHKTSVDVFLTKLCEKQIHLKIIFCRENVLKGIKSMPLLLSVWFLNITMALFTLLYISLSSAADGACFPPAAHSHF